MYAAREKRPSNQIKAITGSTGQRKAVNTASAWQVPFSIRYLPSVAVIQKVEDQNGVKITPGRIAGQSNITTLQHWRSLVENSGTDYELLDLIAARIVPAMKGRRKRRRKSR